MKEAMRFEVNGKVYEKNAKGNRFFVSDEANGIYRKRIGEAAYEKAWDEFIAISEADEEFDANAEIEARKEAEEKKDRETEAEFNGVDHYTVRTYFAGMTGYVVEKNGVEVYNGFSVDEIIEQFGFNPNEVTEIDIPRKKTTEVEKKEEPKAKKVRKPRRSKDVAFEMDTLYGHITLTAKQVDFIHHLPDTYFWENGLDSTPWCDVLADEIGGQFADKPMTTGAMISTLREKGLIYVGTDRVNGRKAKFMALTDLGKVIAKKLGLN